MTRDMVEYLGAGLERWWYIEIELPFSLNQGKKGTASVTKKKKQALYSLAESPLSQPSKSVVQVDGGSTGSGGRTATPALELLEYP